MMQPDRSSDLLVDGSPAANRASAGLALVAALALAGNCLLNSPRGFSAEHQQDTSLLKHVITALALGGAFPTDRGVEIRNLIFYGGAVLLTLIAGLRIATTDRIPRLSGDDLLDFRRRATSPYFWWFLLLLVSTLSSMFSHAPEACKGQTIIRFLHLAWWWPLAVLLAPRHARRLAGALAVILGVTAALGLWYFRARDLPNARLIYPIGNELWLAACLLPGVFIAFAFCVGDAVRLLLRGSVPRRPARAAPADDPTSSRCILRVAASLIAVAAILAALWLTRSRSAGLGLAAGVFAIVWFYTARTSRQVTLLVALILAIITTVNVQNQRTSSVMGERGHSIRVRLNYQWPYALRMFFDKPVAGFGDGAYSLLAGRFAREDQLDEPGTMRFDARSWIGRTHNEFLQLMADLGLVGALAFGAAIVLTLHTARRYCDRLRGDPAAFSDRALVIGLAAALIGLVIEEFSSPALREPGLPPIFLTVWAVLWALVRGERGTPEPAPDRAPLRNLALRLSGVAAAVCAAFLGYFGVQDWRAARAYRDAQVHLEAQRHAEAITPADLAGQYLLDPFRKVNAWIIATSARSGEFARRLNASELPPTEADMAFVEDALARLGRLDNTAPRFLASARFRAELWANRAHAHRRRGETAKAQDALKAAVAAWEQHRRDEPFDLEVVLRLWKLRPDAPARERLDWLRCLLRNSEISTNIVQLFRELSPRDDFVHAMNYLFDTAGKDLSRRPSQWSDPLSPESFRLAALAQSLSGRPGDAVALAAKAVALYDKAGPGLFAAHAAALHESVQYRFDADPTAATDQNLADLAEAYSIRRGPTETATPLPNTFGGTRLRILLAAGREGEARSQLEALAGEATSPIPTRMAVVYLRLADRFGARAPDMPDALTWTRRAIELAPGLTDGYHLLTHLLLHKGDDAQALDAATRYLSAMQDRKTAYEDLAALQARYPGNPMWTEFRSQNPDFPPPPPPTTSPVPVATQPATGTTQPTPGTTQPAPVTPRPAPVTTRPMSSPGVRESRM